MQLRTSNESLSSTYALIAIPLVAMVTFVVGYTASRAHLSQAGGSNAVVEEFNSVIPHQATMWSDLGG